MRPLRLFPAKSPGRVARRPNDADLAFCLLFACCFFPPSFTTYPSLPDSLAILVASLVWSIWPDTGKDFLAFMAELVHRFV